MAGGGTPPPATTARNGNPPPPPFGKRRSPPPSRPRARATRERALPPPGRGPPGAGRRGSRRRSTTARARWPSPPTTAWHCRAAARGWRRRPPAWPAAAWSPHLQQAAAPRLVAERVAVALRDLVAVH